MNFLKKIYFHILIFVLIYIEFGYLMNVTAVIQGGARMFIILAATLPLIFMIKSIRTSSFVLLSYLLVLVLLNSLRDASLKNSILLLIPIFIGFVIANSVNFYDLA